MLAQADEPALISVCAELSAEIVIHVAEKTLNLRMRGAVAQGRW